MDNINLFVPKFRTDECLEEIRECLDKGWTGLGFKTVEFEEKWREYSGLDHAHFVNSATAGLHLAVRLLKDRHGWKDGDEIISTPLTFVSTNHAILYEQLQPVFADVDKFLCLDPASILQRITPRTRAVMFVGQGGSTGQLDAVADICKEHGLKLILDAAHMAGTLHNGQHVGSLADVCVFSFQAVKNLPTADSGMVCFRDGELDSDVRKWTWLGINKDTYQRTHDDGKYKWHYDVENVGFKYHGNSVVAALGLVGLRYLDEDNGHRRTLAARYEAGLEDVAAVGRIPVPQNCVSARHLYQVLVDDRDEIMLRLNSHNIFPGVHYRDNSHYDMYASMSGTCQCSQDYSDRLISLPLHLNMEASHVDHVVACLKDSLAA